MELCDICDDETATHEELRQMRGQDGHEQTYYVDVCDNCCEDLADCAD